MPLLYDPRRSLTALELDSTLIAVIEMSQSSWLVAAIVPGVERQPLKKLEPDGAALLRLLQRWRDEATHAGRTITRLAVAFEAGRDGFWLARWLRARGVEAHVIHPSSVAASREHRRAKTDRLDTELLKRAYLGWLRGEPHHCSMATVPTLDERDAKRPTRERENLVGERTRVVSRMRGCLARFGIRGFKPTLRRAPERLAELRTPEGAALPPHALAELRRDLARLRLITDQIKEVGGARAERIEPDESGARRREKGLAKAGKARVRRGMIQLAWRFLRFQETSALAQWYRARTADARGGTRKTLIVALARKLLIALWRLATTGEVPAGVTLRPQVGTASA